MISYQFKQINMQCFYGWVESMKHKSHYSFKTYCIILNTINIYMYNVCMSLRIFFSIFTNHRFDKYSFNKLLFTAIYLFNYLPFLKKKSLLIFLLQNSTFWLKIRNSKNWNIHNNDKPKSFKNNEHATFRNIGNITSII